MNSQIAMWYAILGLITCVIGIYRSLKNKQSLPPDELTSLSWFMCWWIWLPVFVVKLVINLVKKLK